MEKNYEKIERLVQLRRDYSSKLATVEQQLKSEKASNSIDEGRMADEWLSRRLDAGLFSLQVR